jgi:hypothetical protein
MQFVLSRSKGARPVALLLSTLLLLGPAGCSSGNGGHTDNGPSPANQPSPTTQAFVDASAYMHSDIQRAGLAVSGPDGLAETVASLQALDLSQPQARQEWGQLAAQFETQIATLEQSIAAAALSAIELAEHEAVLAQMRADALSDSEGEIGAQPKIISLAAVFIVTTTAITLTRVYRNIRDLSHRNQNLPVRRVATASDEGRQAVANALRSNGVDVPADATGEQVADVFEEQSGRYIRANVTQVARDFNITQAGSDGPAAIAAQDNMEAQIEQNAQAARDAGVVATDAVVNLSTAGPTGLNAGVEGTILVLTATERMPGDYINRHVDAVVAAQQRQPLETTPATVDPEEARRQLQDAAQGGPDLPSPDEATAFAESLVATLREQAEQFAPLVDLPMRIAFGSATLSPQDEENSTLTTSIAIPGFEAGDTAEVLIVREDAQPIERAAQQLGPATPLELTHTPLLGTLVVSAVPVGPAVDGERPWRAQIDVNRVAAATQLVADGVNVTVSPRVTPISSDASTSVDVTAFGSATLRVRRLDTGESYLLALTDDEDAQDQCPGVGTFACGDGSVICADLVCSGSPDCSDGSDEDSDTCGSQDSCCEATQGCPSETGDNCAESCCCCPFGQVCDRVDFSNGCVPE